MKEYDVFILKEDLNPILPKGSRGVILLTYPNNLFEVEFVKEDATNVKFEGKSTFTISGDIIKLLEVPSYNSLETFKINITNETKKRRLFNLFTFGVSPFLILLIYFQDFLFKSFEENTKFILTIIIMFIPPLILALKLRKHSSEEDVSVGKNEIITSLIGVVKLNEIIHSKIPTKNSWNSDLIEITLKNGDRIIFSPLSRQFRNKKHKAIFIDFKNKLEKVLASNNQTT